MDAQSLSKPSERCLVQREEHSFFANRPIETSAERGISGELAILNGYLVVARAVACIFGRSECE